MTNRDQRTGGPNRGQWYEQTPVIVAAGAAGVLAVVLIVFAVLQTSRHATAPEGTSFTSESPTTTSPAVLRTITTTSMFTPTGSSTATLFPPDTPSPGPSTASTGPDDTTSGTGTSTGTTTMSNMFATTTTTR